jgi:hypothetical protein
MSRREWDFWIEGADLSSTAMDSHMQQFLVSCAQKNLAPLKKSIELVEGEKEIVPGISVIPARGHTPGHLAVEISSTHSQLLHMSHAVLHALHLEIPRGVRPLILRQKMRVKLGGVCWIVPPWITFRCSPTISHFRVWAGSRTRALHGNGKQPSHGYCQRSSLHPDQRGRALGNRV